MARRDYKTVSEWKKAYQDKEKLMNERDFWEVEPREFYRAIFLEGSLQQHEGDGKGNIIASQIRPSGECRTKQWIVDDSLKMQDVMEPYMNRMIKLEVKIGTMSVLSAMAGKRMLSKVNFKSGLIYHEMLEDVKKEEAAYLCVQDYFSRLVSTYDKRKKSQSATYEQYIGMGKGTEVSQTTEEK